MNVQQDLLTAIWNDDSARLAESGFDIRGINIYRRNLLANAQRALSITFPTIFQLLDSDVIENLVKSFLTLYPPDKGDWAQWGETFSCFISTSEIAYEYSYLPDCARLDWHIHCALHGKDQTLDQKSLLLLGSADPGHIFVILNENVAFITTEYPIENIFNAHHNPDPLQREVAMEEAKVALSMLPTEHTVMISRPEFQPKITTLTESDEKFICSLNTGKSLAESLDTVCHYDDFSFEKWLITSIEKNLISYFKET